MSMSEIMMTLETIPSEAKLRMMVASTSLFGWHWKPLVALVELAEKCRKFGIPIIAAVASLPYA